MKKIILSLVLVVGMQGIASAADSKIGYVDIQKAIQSTKAGKKAKKQLETQFNKKKKELAKLESDIKKMTKDLEKKKLVLTDEKRLKKQQEIQREMLKYREMVGKSQVEIQEKERKLTLPILKKIRTVIGKIAEKEGYTFVLEKSEQSVLWAKKEADLTEKVVKAYDK